MLDLHIKRSPSPPCPFALSVSLSVSLSPSLSLSLSSELLYNLTADVDKRQKAQPSRVYFTHNREQTTVLSQSLGLDVNRQECHRYTAYVRVSLPSLPSDRRPGSRPGGTSSRPWA